MHSENPFEQIGDDGDVNFHDLDLESELAFRHISPGFCHGSSMLEHRPRGAKKHLVTSELNWVRFWASDGCQMELFLMLTVYVLVVPVWSMTGLR